MKMAMSILIGLFFFTIPVKSQSKYLFFKNADIRTEQEYVVIGFNYWRYDSCLYSKRMCRYNVSSGMKVKRYATNDTFVCELLRGNNSGYQSKNPYDAFEYLFVPQNINASQLVRKLLIKDTYVRVDTFNLRIIDTLFLDNYALVKKVFGKMELDKQKNLKIYVLKSIDEFGSTMLHYWVERIGIVKLTDEKCWRYSFEMKDERTQLVKRLFAELIEVIKKKYEDPYWLSEPCIFE